MSTFRTTLSSVDFPFSFDHTLPVLSIGSCFAEHIGAKLNLFKFCNKTNPAGIIYNPISITKSLDFLMGQELYTKENLIKVNDLWCSLDHHGSFSKLSAENTLDAINTSIKSSRDFLPKVDRLIITLGTSYAFRLKKTQAIVANCHKIPGNEFDRIKLTPEFIIQQLSNVFQRLKDANYKIEILMTVSPIRHIRDGLVENQRSKASLILACAELCAAHSFVHYFPAYELLMDDLRDYRFYKTDMIHPSETAIDYIWDYFQKCFFEMETISLNKKIAEIIEASQHRPFNPKSPQHQDFITQQIKKIDQLNIAHPLLDFEKEKSILFTNRI